MSDGRKIEVLKPFGPTMCKTVIPEDILNKLNTYVDELLNDEKKIISQNHGDKLAGNVSQEFFIDKEFAKKIGWLDFLFDASHKWIEVSTGKQIGEFNLLESWIVRQFANEYNPAHYHGGHISGAGFLKVPSTFGQTVQKDKTRNLNGKLKMIHGNRQFLSQSMYVIKPRVGEFYFFPHYMMHTVYPFAGTEEERRSISFNATIDQKIFNVFGG